ncbi:MAG: thermonuclease family protein [Verrucomicrobiales bacterium]
MKTLRRSLLVPGIFLGIAGAALGAKWTAYTCRFAEALIENGLARAYGMRVAWPPDSRSDEDDFMRELERLESAAKRHRRGIWGSSK